MVSGEKKHSTELATIELVDRILSDIDNKFLPVVVFMDLSKAFDTLDHTILIHKLQYYGITGIALNWYQSYLSNRLQYVDISGSISSMQHITTGVPQGSVLGPLLFLIYMNDLPNVNPFIQIYTLCRRHFIAKLNRILDTYKRHQHDWFNGYWIMLYATG